MLALLRKVHNLSSRRGITEILGANPFASNDSKVHLNLREFNSLFPFNVPRKDVEQQD